MDLRVGVVASYFYPRGYGGKAVYDLCRQLVKDGLEVHVVTSHRTGEPTYSVLNGIGVYRLRTHFFRFSNTEYPFSPTALADILKIFKVADIDLVHCNFEVFQTTLATSGLKYALKKPLLLTMHGQGLTSSSSYGTIFLDLSWLINHNIVERFAVKSSDHIIALTAAVKQKALKLGAHPNKVSVIPNGVDTEQFKPSDPSEDYRKLSSIADHKTVIFVGRLHPTHGINLLLNAIPLVTKVYPDSRFVLVGDGPLRQYVLKFIEEHNLQNYVKVLGYRQDIPELFGVADLLVYPALSVGMPLSMLEGMACGKPVIAFDIEGNREIITHEKTGFLVRQRTVEELTCVINHALSNPKMLVDMGKNARAHMESDFSWGKVSKKVQTVYNMLVN